MIAIGAAIGGVGVFIGNLEIGFNSLDRVIFWQTEGDELKRDLTLSDEQIKTDFTARIIRLAQAQDEQAAKILLQEIESAKNQLNDLALLKANLEAKGESTSALKTIEAKYLKEIGENQAKLDKLKSGVP